MEANIFINKSKVSLNGQNSLFQKFFKISTIVEKTYIFI